jgi:catechol 2,3-dioxygenase-like lactoylglutathione lyase family enzyme
MSPEIVHAVLHCALNTTDRAAAGSLYEQLEMNVVMRVNGNGLDGGPVGIPGPTDSQVSFIYDHRGPRVATAIELQEWTKPATSGEACGPSEVGVQALGFHVPSTSDAVERLVSGGAVRLERAAPGAVDAVVLDKDGVTIELMADADVAAPELRYLRMLCGDLEHTVPWYAAIGFSPLGKRRRVVWTEGGGTAVETTEQRMRVAGPPTLDLHLTADPRSVTGQKAHVAANHRGLFRIALAVRDVAAAVETARRELGLQCLDPTLMLLPGSSLGGVTVSTLLDPDGVMLEFVERDI